MSASDIQQQQYSLQRAASAIVLKLTVSIAEICFSSRPILMFPLCPLCALASAITCPSQPFLNSSFHVLAAYCPQ